jgi:hypothetical protein
VDLGGADAQREFPEWRGSNLEIAGDWKASPIVAIGDVTNITAYGEQNVSSLPWPMSPDVHELYWCQGDFRAIEVVKGELPAPPKKYLWASSLPGCALWYGDARFFQRLATRVWFLRVEGEFLRPTFDGGTARLFGLFTKWDDGPRLPARQRLGVLLLTPAANSDTPEDFARYLWNSGDIACDLLGKAQCALQIRSLTELASPALREAACNYLKGQLGEECSVSPNRDK